MSMVYKKTPHWLAILSVILAAGCSGSNNSDSGSDTTPVQLNSFTVQGTSPRPVLSSQETIDPSENNGQFSVSWNINGPSTYTASLYVSKDTFPHNPDDIRFFRVVCDGTSQTCGQSATFTCSFQTNNQISCNSGELHDLTNWLDQLPQNAYIIFEASTNNSAVGQSVPVQFR